MEYRSQTSALIRHIFDVKLVSLEWCSKYRKCYLATEGTLKVVFGGFLGSLVGAWFFHGGRKAKLVMKNKRGLDFVIEHQGGN